MRTDTRYQQAFREEALDLLAELETALLELESRPEDRELINRVFRAMHTIKGSGSMFGFENIASFTHDVETVFDLVRNGELGVNRKLLDLALRSRDQILLMLNNDDAVTDQQSQTEIVSALRSLIPSQDVQPPARNITQPTPREIHKPLGTTVYRIRIKPALRIFSFGANPLHLLDDLRGMGRAEVIGYTEAIPVLPKLNAEDCYTWWEVILITKKSEEELRYVFEFVYDICEFDIVAVHTEEDFDSEVGIKRLGEILVARGDITTENLHSFIQAKKPIGQILTESGIVSENQVEAALAEQTAIRQLQGDRHKSESVSSVRVEAVKLDALVDLVGELVIVQAQLSQVVNGLGNPVLTTLTEQLARLSDDLRDNTMSIRMLPIGSSFSKLRRLIRDLSAQLGKEVNLVTRGEETELDKTVIERLNDPLVHLLRNSLDHGIEKPDARVALGKPRVGSITLSAEHSGGEVLVEIADDGGGLDAEAIRRSAVAKGLIADDAILSEDECHKLIFMPGFSTAKQLTSVSGRGVGMDVVKRNIDALRGSIEISSRKGQGMSILIRLPLTLAIIEGLQVKVGNDFFVIPLALVEECVELICAEDHENGKIVNLRGEIVPYIRLREWFHFDGTRPNIEQIVVTQVEGRRIGIVVDEVVGEHQTVIKSLGRVYRDAEGFSGATIKGDGTIALILDIPQLLRCVLLEVETGTCRQ